MFSRFEHLMIKDLMTFNPVPWYLEIWYIGSSCGEQSDGEGEHLCAAGRVLMACTVPSHPLRALELMSTREIKPRQWFWVYFYRIVFYLSPWRATGKLSLYICIYIHTYIHSLWDYCCYFVQCFKFSLLACKFILLYLEQLATSYVN